MNYKYKYKYVTFLFEKNIILIIMIGINGKNNILFIL